jgi:hypothetical protein
MKDLRHYDMVETEEHVLLYHDLRDELFCVISKFNYPDVIGFSVLTNYVSF